MVLSYLNKIVRIVLLCSPLLLTILGLLFYKFGNLYYFLDETSEILPVASLFSQGKEEDYLIVFGWPLFLILSIFNFVRFKERASFVDLFALLAVLLIQTIMLLLINVASFSLSMDQNYGWIIKYWLFTFFFLWLVFFLISTTKLFYKIFSLLFRSRLKEAM